MKQMESFGVTAAQIQEDERSKRRLRMLKRAVLAFEGQFRSLQVVVRDMSESGARLELSDTLALPRFFKLHVEIDGFKVDCELVWQGLNFAGVRFIGDRQHTTIGRKQVLKTSETALSEQFLREEAERRRREMAEQVSLQTNQPCAVRPPLRKTLTFGKRKFEG